MVLPVFKIDSSEDHPSVILDRENNKFEIKGRAMMEDCIKFFGPVKEWISNYVKEPNENTSFVVSLEYFNSSSAKMLTKIFLELDKITLTGKKYKIIWHYKENDDIIRDRGKELQNILRLPFDIKME
jgi:hypothetical protein